VGISLQRGSKPRFSLGPLPKLNHYDFLEQPWQNQLLRFSFLPSPWLSYFPHDLQVARNSDVVFTMLGLPSEVEDVILGRSGLLRNLASGSIVIDMSTSRPELARRIAGMSHVLASSMLDKAFQYTA
jgi:hypothetical protein